MNTVILSGAIAPTPEFRQTREGKSICEFHLLFTNPSKSGSTKKIKCLSFGRLAEAVAQFHESQAVVLIGSINIINKEDKTRLIEFKISSFDTVPFPVNINSICLAGRTGRDTEIRFFDSGNSKASTSLAVRRTSDQTDWFDLEAWGKTGEVMSNYVAKGGLIAVQGQIKFEEWNDKNTGGLRTKIVVNVGELELLGRKREQEEVAF